MTARTLLGVGIRLIGVVFLFVVLVGVFALFGISSTIGTSDEVLPTLFWVTVIGGALISLGLILFGGKLAALLERSEEQLGINGDHQTAVMLFMLSMKIYGVITVLDAIKVLVTQFLTVRVYGSEYGAFMSAGLAKAQLFPALFSLVMGVLLIAVAGRLARFLMAKVKLVKSSRDQAEA